MYAVRRVISIFNFNSSSFILRRKHINAIQKRQLSVLEAAAHWPRRVWWGVSSAQTAAWRTDGRRGRSPPGRRLWRTARSAAASGNTRTAHVYCDVSSLLNVTEFNWIVMPIPSYFVARILSASITRFCDGREGPLVRASKITRN